MRILRIESDYDEVTKDLHLGLTAFVQTGHTVRTCFGQKAVRSEVMAQNGPFDFVTGAGHGDAQVFYGQGRQEIVFSPVSPSGPEANAIVYLIACNCGQVLGPALVSQNQIRAFVGYDDFFNLPHDTSLPGTAANAIRSIYLLEPLAVMKGIASDLSWPSIRQLATKAYGDASQELDQLMASLNQPASPWLSVLKLNHDGLVGPWSDKAACHRFRKR